MPRWLITAAITIVLVAFAGVPLLFILYGGAGGVIGGAAIVGALIVVQYPIYLVLRRLWRAPEGRDGPDESAP